MLRWAMSRFNDAGSSTDMVKLTTPGMRPLQLVLPALHLPPDVDPAMRHSPA